MNVSILILTLNEEANIARCLESVSWSNDIVLLDSFSIDDTENIASQYNVRFIQRQFDNYANQRNFGLNEIQYSNSWLLMVDADEEVPSELAGEIEAVVRGASEEITLFRMRRKDYLLGRWIKRSSGYPTWFGRLMRIGKVSVNREINEEYHTDGKVGNLHQHLNHYPFNKGFAAWLEKHNRYSTMEAQYRINNHPKKVEWSGLFSSDPQTRRIIHKKIFYSMPLRPLLAFVALYFIKGGIMEGRAGFTFSVLRATYEFMIDVKVEELRCREKNLPI